MQLLTLGTQFDTYLQLKKFDENHTKTDLIEAIGNVYDRIQA